MINKVLKVLSLIIFAVIHIYIVFAATGVILMVLNSYNLNKGIVLGGSFLIAIGFHFFILKFQKISNYIDDYRSEFND